MCSVRLHEEIFVAVFHGMAYFDHISNILLRLHDFCQRLSNKYSTLVLACMCAYIEKGSNASPMGVKTILSLYMYSR